MATLKLGMEDVTPVDLVPYAQGIHDAVQGNPLFPSPIPSMADFQDAINALMEANARVAAERGRSDFLAKNVALTQLRRQLKRLSAYVSLVADGDASIILSSGFGVRKKASRVGELNRPNKLRNRLTRTTGRVELDWEVIPGAKLYHVYMSESMNDPQWKLAAITSKSRYNADGLTSGRFYYFAVSAIGTAGETSLSEPLRAMAS